MCFYWRTLTEPDKHYYTEITSQREEHKQWEVSKPTWVDTCEEEMFDWTLTDEATSPAPQNAGSLTWKVVETDVEDATPETVPRSGLAGFRVHAFSIRGPSRLTVPGIFVGLFIQRCLLGAKN